MRVVIDGVRYVPCSTIKKIDGVSCPLCHSTQTKVTDSRYRDKQRRRRKCLICDHRWSTIEVCDG